MNHPIKEKTNSRKTLRELFQYELSEIYNTEQRLIDVLPKLASAATCSKLRDSIETHLEETRGHIRKVKLAFLSIGKKATSSPHHATIGLLTDGEEVVSKYQSSSVADAALIRSAQKMEHHEIASYECLRTWSRRLGYHHAARLIDEILDEEKSAYLKLSEQAKKIEHKENIEPVYGEPQTQPAEWERSHGQMRAFNPVLDSIRLAMNFRENLRTHIPFTAE